MTALSLDRLSSLIGAIYDCVLEPDKWRSALDDVRAALRFQNAVLGASGLPNGEVILGVSLGIEPAFLAQMPAHGDDVIALWGGPERIMRYPLEEPIVHSRVVDPAVLEASAYYRDWVRGQGLIDAVAIAL